MSHVPFRNIAGRPRILAAGLVAVSLASCAAGPDYRRPAAPIADTYRSASLLAQRPVSGPAAPLEQWWRGFHDPLLDQLVNEALAQNLDIAAAGARVDQARSAARAAGAQLLPVGQASADAARQRQSLRSPTGQLFSHFPGYQRTGSLYDLNAGAAWEIDLFGQLRRGAEAARADAAAAEAGRAGARLTIAAETVDTYIQIRALQARLARLQQRVAAAELAERLTEQKFQDGVASDIERQQIRAQAAQARAALPLLRTGLEAQMNRLDVLLAQPAGHNRARLEGGDAVIPSPPSIAAGDGPAELLRRRPDLIAAERRLAADNARIGVALADYWPHVSLSGLAGFEATRSGDLTTGPAQLAAGRAATAWRLFDFGRVDAEVKAARAKRTEALALWKQAVLQAGAEVEDATVALVSREQHAAELDRALTAARTAEQLVSQSVEAGAASQLDLALARSQRLQAEDAELEARSDAARSAVALCRALGGGWSPRG
jgi:NodT family efflux transporter outer membrane factor (OMF) lipoprotein